MALIKSWASAARPAAAVALTLMGLAASGAAYAASPFSGLGGTWSGSGHVRLENGRSEAIRCTANYVPRNGGAALGLSLRCASASNRIELRASLTLYGDRVRGSWEERSFNASGSIGGIASGSSLRLRFSGSIEGAMLVTTSGRSQSISVRTDTTALRGVTVSLRRN
jgi:hypothetical protein